MEFYKLTDDDVRNAVTYVSTVDKMAFINETATKCFDTLDITANSESLNSALPSCYKVNTDRRSRFLMGAFVKMYLGKEIETEDDDPWLMSIPEYDMYAGGHVFEDMNRMKNNAALRDTCFDILTDYSELKYRLDSDIKGLLEAMNSSATRLLAYLEASSTPEALEKVIQQAEKSEKQLREYKKQREGNADGLSETEEL